jgi:ubiquinone/menaquinone biosynthesis C-methylase UbiE
LTQAFDLIADSYDQWYDTSEGRAVLRAESACLRLLCAQCRGRWLEVGVGTGRFAALLGVAEGIDPSPRMLEIASRQGIKTYTGFAEDLPFTDESFEGVLLALTLCFVADSKRAVMECRRVLRPKGQLLVGAIPADSPWGRQYERKKAAGHPVYTHARFFTTSEIVALIESAGFDLQNAASTLLWGPGAAPEIEPRVEPGIVPEAGSLGLLFTKTVATCRCGNALEERR